MDELLYVICRGIVEFFVKRIPEPLWQSLTMRKRGVRIAAILLFYLLIFALMAVFAMGSAASYPDSGPWCKNTEDGTVY